WQIARAHHCRCISISACSGIVHVAVISNGLTSTDVIAAFAVYAGLSASRARSGVELYELRTDPAAGVGIQGKERGHQRTAQPWCRFKSSVNSGAVVASLTTGHWRAEPLLSRRRPCRRSPSPPV